MKSFRDNISTSSILMPANSNNDINNENNNDNEHYNDLMRKSHVDIIKNKI